MPEIIITAVHVIHGSLSPVPFRFLCRPVEELSVHWKRNGIRLTSGLHSYGRRLTIINPTSADTGMYVCEATLRGSTFEPARAKAFLSIIGNAQPRGTGCILGSSSFPPFQADNRAAVHPTDLKYLCMCATSVDRCGSQRLISSDSHLVPSNLLFEIGSLFRTYSLSFYLD